MSGAGEHASAANDEVSPSTGAGNLASHSVGPDDQAPRPVGAPLGIGILLAPEIFAWFLLREGYAARARMIGFGWMVVHLVLMIVIEPAPESEAASGGEMAAQKAAAPVETMAAAAQPTTPASPVAAQTPPLKPDELSDPDCTRTDQTESWKQIEINAILTADRYAVRNNPRAAFADARAQVSWNPDPDHTEDLKKGTYSLILTNDQVALAELVPLFDFCTPASQLDPEGELWKVELAKLHGKYF